MFILPDLPYDFNALEPFIDEETMHLHHDKHHAAYIKNTNDALVDNPDLLNMNPIDLYKDLNVVPEKVRAKVSNNLGGHINHSMFWEVMTPQSEFTDLVEDSALNAKITSDFGSLDSFKAVFEEQAMARFGSGWVWLVVGNGNLEVLSTPNQDNPIKDGKHPILGLDLWEHAYYLKYKNVRADYVKAWWNIVNWKKVEDNYKKVGETK